MNPQHTDNMKHWRHDATEWAAEAQRWQAEQARATAALRELEGFLGAHGDQLVSFAEQVTSLGTAAADPARHDAARNLHHEAKAQHLALKDVHHGLMARTNALRDHAAK